MQMRFLMVISAIMSMNGCSEEPLNPTPMQAGDGENATTICANNGGNICPASDACTDVVFVAGDNSICCAEPCGGETPNCAEQGGNVCQPDQSCAEVIYETRDGFTCCEVPCGGSMTCAEGDGHPCLANETCGGELIVAADTETCCTQPCDAGGSTCVALGGQICASGETCAQSIIPASDSSRCCPVACTAVGPIARVVLVPPPQGMYLGVAERAPGQVRAFESHMGKKSLLFWPFEDVNEGPMEGAPDSTTAFNATKAQLAWDAGYLVITGSEPRPDVGYLVDDVLRGVYDVHFRRQAEGLRQFGKPVLFESAREPNVVLREWKGGYGPAGDQSFTWALDNGRLTGEFDPSGFPNAGLYAGLGNDNVDDGVERLAAMHRYLYDFFVNREGLNNLTFGTMGWGIMGTDVPEEGYLPLSDFVNLYRLIEEYTDWLTLNFYSYTYCAQPNLTMLEAWMARFQQEGITKPILFTELGFCSPNRKSNITAIFGAFVNDHPQVAGFSLWMVDGCHLDGDKGFDEIKTVIDTHPNYFHSCPVFSDGSTMPSCSATPFVGTPTGLSCAEACQAEGDPTEVCVELCGGHVGIDPQQCLNDCMANGEGQGECAAYCGSDGC